MKARLTSDACGYVTLAHDVEGFDGLTRIERLFRCPVEGGYVREYIRGEWKQVCVGLSHMGVTLMCPSRDKLAEVIQRQYQRNYTKPQTIFRAIAPIGDDGHGLFTRESIGEDLTDSQLLYAAELALECRRESARPAEKARFTRMLNTLRDMPDVAAELASMLRGEHIRLRELELA